MNIVEYLTKDLTQVEDKTKDGCRECYLAVGTKECMIPKTLECPCAEHHHFEKNCFCEGLRPFDKCRTCKRFIANVPASEMVWLVDPCEYLPM